MSTSIHEVTEATFDAEVLASSVPVLVDFTATWCAPCRALAPILEKIGHEQAGRVKVVAVDGDDSPCITTRFGVRGFHTVSAFARRREVGRHIGTTTMAKLLAMVDGHVVEQTTPGP